MKNQVTINKEQGLFVISSGSGYSCLGFEVCQRWHAALALELGADPWKGILKNKKHLMRLYKAYQKLIKQAGAKNKATGWRSKSQLTPQLIGLEGRRVKVTDCFGETYSFQVGKSTGVIPCHLMIAWQDSTGGCAVYGAPFKKLEINR